MVTIQKRHSGNFGGLVRVPLLILIFFVVLSLVVYVFLPDAAHQQQGGQLSSKILRVEKAIESNPQIQKLENRIKSQVSKRREQLGAALDSISEAAMPQRLRLLRDKNQVVGERLADIKAGKETVQEILHAGGNDIQASDKPPMTIEEITNYLEKWIQGLHETLSEYKKAKFEGIWKGELLKFVRECAVWKDDMW